MMNEVRDGDRSLSRLLERQLAAVLILVLIFGALYFIGLGRASLWEMDEALYAEIAREMYVSGDYVVPHYNYVPHFEKPPLGFWLTAFSYRIFGVTEFAARFFSALFGLAGVVLIYFLIRRSRGPRAALAGAVILGGSFEYAIMATMGLLDMPVTFFTIMTFFGLHLAVLEGKPRWFLLAGLGAALAVLTKGPAFVLLPGAALLVYIAVEELRGNRVFRRLLTPWLPAAFCLFLILVLPWYAAIYLRLGPAYFSRNFGYMFSLVTRSVLAHGEPWFYYLLVLPVALLPWTPGLFGGVRLFFARSRERAGLLFFAWLAVYFLFFSIARTKLPGYIMPLLPAAAAVAAPWWDALMSRGAAGRARWLLPATLGVIALALLGALLGVRRSVPADYLPVYRALFFAPAALGGAGALLAAILHFCRRMTVVFAGIVLLALVGWVGVLHVFAPLGEPYRPARAVAEEIKARRRPGEQVIAASLGDYAGLPFYLGERVEVVHLREAARLIAGKSRVYLAASPDELRRLAALLPEEHPPAVLYARGNGVLVSNRGD